MHLTLPELQQKIQEWDGCELSKTANAVIGEGNPHAEIMFIGEAPGQKENELKRPFVGAAGQLLNKLLALIDLKREDVYISNVVKYRPPENRDPTDEEKQQCMPWLKLEIALIRPKVIVPLGRHALGHFFPTLGMTAAHGKPQKLTDAITVFPIYHPAAALHNRGLQTDLENDFKALRKFLDERRTN